MQRYVEALHFYSAIIILQGTTSTHSSYRTVTSAQAHHAVNARESQPLREGRAFSLNLSSTEP